MPPLNREVADQIGKSFSEFYYPTFSASLGPVSPASLASRASLQSLYVSNRVTRVFSLPSRRLL